MAKALVVNDLVECPYCGRKGLIVEIYGDRELFIRHALDEMDIPSAATGKMIRASVFMDGCRRGIKCGLVHSASPATATPKSPDAPSLELEFQAG